MRYPLFLRCSKLRWRSLSSRFSKHFIFNLRSDRQSQKDNCFWTYSISCETVSCLTVKGLNPGVITLTLFMILLLFVSTRSILLSCLVGFLTSWVSPWSSMISSSRSELNDQFVVGSRSFHLRSGALKSSATITLYCLI